MGVQSLGFEKDLMRRLVGEAMDLVLDRRAIARPDALDDTRVHRAAIEIGADHIVRACIRMRDPAWHLPRMPVGRPEKGEHRNRVEIPGLLLEARIVDRPSVDARRRPRLQPALRKSQILQPRREGNRRRISSAPRREVLQANVNQAVEKRAGGQDYGGSAKADSRTESPPLPRAHLAASGHQPLAGTATGSADFPDGAGSPSYRAHDRLERESHVPRVPSIG